MGHSAKKRSALRSRLLENLSGLIGYGILWRQLAILDRRVRDELEACLHGPVGRESRGHIHVDILRLDTETFYTVAHDVLKLAAFFVRKPNNFKEEPAYKTICSIRNHLVRHAYDKANGDTYSGFGFGELYGPQLKAGSRYSRFRDPGYLPNYEGFIKLLNDYQVTPDQLAKRWSDLATLADV